MYIYGKIINVNMPKRLIVYVSTSLSNYFLKIETSSFLLKGSKNLIYSITAFEQEEIVQYLL